MFSISPKTFLLKEKSNKLRLQNISQGLSTKNLFKRQALHQIEPVEIVFSHIF